jgi:hypothetical protein
MAESTLRENRRSATHQNATTVNRARMRVLVQQAFYQHDHLGPGAELVEITGQGEGDGYYDWAGRRLFLADGEPDPMCPGAYRYQHNPACCDLQAPESDPRSPRYEPMHLRHKPGDTWIIDTNRPHDPLDPGPFGTPGWREDRRTGRHRRDETPDPLPAEGWTPPADAWFPGTADWPEPEPPQPEPGRASDRRNGSDHRGDSDRTSGHRSRSDQPRPTRAGEPFGDPQPASNDWGGSDRPPPWGSRGRPVPSEPDEPPRRDRFWTEADGCAGPDGHGCNGSSTDQRADRADRRYPSDDSAHGEHQFSKLREDAFDRFMANSAQLRAAHFQPERPYLRERIAWVARWLFWVLACGLAPMPAPLSTRQPQSDPAALQPIPAQLSATTRSRPDSTPAEVLASDPAPVAAPATAPTDNPNRPDAKPAARPGAAIAAAVNGALAARKVIAAREVRTNFDLAVAVRNSANRASTTRPPAEHLRTRPRETRRRPSPQPGHYMAAWEQAFDTGGTLIFGGAA